MIEGKPDEKDTIEHMVQGAVKSIQFLKQRMDRTDGSLFPGGFEIALVIDIPDNAREQRPEKAPQEKSHANE